MSGRPRGRRPRSLALVNTGGGKGKSTAAFGGVMRAVARDWRVFVIIDAISARPEHVYVVATGRDAPARLIEIADTVTEMRKVKHVYDRGVRASRGIDF